MLVEIKIVAMSAIFGMAYVFFATILGSKITSIVWSDQSTDSKDLRVIASLIFGVLLHALTALIVMAVFPNALSWTCWLLVLYVALDWKRSLNFIYEASRPMLISAVYGLACFLILVAFQYGAARGDNIFWTVYYLTGITPGDSPQGLFQAQYILFGESLRNLHDFSLFDRPFLGGIITLVALSAVDLLPGKVYESYSIEVAFAYFALWIWLNASIVYVILDIAKRYATGIPRFVVVVIALASPGLVFNIIGAWPKLFCVYIIYCASLIAIRGYWRLAAFFGGVSFLVHGSFLWAHLALLTTLILYIVFSAKSINNKLFRVATVALIGISFPVIWFGVEHSIGATPPLRIYYLYSVPVNYALYHSIEGIAGAFYSSTSPANLIVLPFVNLVKSFLPFDVLQWIGSFSYAGPVADWRSFARALFDNQSNRFAFILGITGGVIALLGIKRNATSDWGLSLALIVFLILPLIPGMTLYRRDDHFIMPIMLYSLIPIVISTALILGRMKLQYLAVVVSLVFFEYILVFASRYPSARYINHNFEYYLWVIFLLFSVLYAGIIIRLALAAKRQGSVLLVKPESSKHG